MSKQGESTDVVTITLTPSECRELHRLGKCFLDEGKASLQHLCVPFQFAVPGYVGSQNLRGAQPQHPAHVLSGVDMPVVAQQVGAH